MKAYNVDNSRIPVGKLYYEFSAHEVGRSVFGINDRNSGRQYGDHRLGATAKIDYGLTRDISLSGGIVVAPIPQLASANGQVSSGGNLVSSGGDGDNYRSYATLGLRTQVEGIAFQLDSAVDNTGGAAFGVSATTQLDQWDLSLDHKRYLNNYRSTASSFGQAFHTTSGSETRFQHIKISESNARAHRSFNLGYGVNASFGVGSGLYQFSDGKHWSVRNNFDVTAGSVSVGNTVKYNGGTKDNASDFEGTSHINMRLFDLVSLRASASYGIGGPDGGLHSLSAGLSAPLPFDISFSAGYSRDLAYGFNEYDSENFYASVRRDFGWAKLGLLGSHTRSQDPEVENGSTIALTVSFNTFTDPKTLDTEITSQPVARQGAVRVTAYHDANGNNIRDKDEASIPEAKVLLAGARTPYYTAAKGGPGRIAKMRPGGWKNLTISAGGLPSTEFSPASKGIAVLPRPGAVVEVALPVARTADIEGAVYFDDGGQRRAMANVAVQVVREDAGGARKVVAKAATEFDGLFVMSEVPIGAYKLMIEPEQAKRIGLSDPIVGDIQVSSDTGVLKNLEIAVDRERSTTKLFHVGKKG